jgi:molecular chaperone GrpE
MTEKHTGQPEDLQPDPEIITEAEEAMQAVQDVAQEEIETLKSELAAWQDKANEYLDGWQRARAEFANYKKRLEREQSLANQNASANVIRRFLEVIDDLELALKNRPQEGDGAGWAAGVELIYRKLCAILEAEGVSAIEAEGQSFDPTLHEAITHEPHPELESGMVIEVIKQGYRLGERVLRPAQVRVAS